MKKITFALLLLYSSFCFSQDAVKPEKQKLSGQHTIYGEAFGNVGYNYSVGYDYTLKLKEKHKLSFICGLQFMPLVGVSDYVFSKDYLFSLAPQISYLYGKNHHLELGIGGTYSLGHFSSRPKEIEWSIPFRIGYRYQRENGGFFFKVAYLLGFTTIPLFFDREVGESVDFWFMPCWAGIAFGYTFKHKPQK